MHESRQFTPSVAALVGGLFALAAAGPAIAQTTVELPLDSQINHGGGDAIYIPFGGGWISFESDATDGWTRRHMDNAGWYALEVDLELAGVGALDLSAPGSTVEFDCRYFQNNANPYADAPIFLRLYSAGGGWRDYGIVYQTGINWSCAPVPDYPAWFHVQIDVGDLNADTNCDGTPDVTSSGFDPTQVTRVRFYGTDWNYVDGAADWIDVKDLRIVAFSSPQPPGPYTVTPVLFVPDPASFPAGYQPDAAEIADDLANITLAMARLRVWYAVALGRTTSLRIQPVVYMPANGGLSDYEIFWNDPQRRYRDGITLGNTWGLVTSEVASRGYGPGTSSQPRITVIFCKGAGGFAGGAQWFGTTGGGMCMLGDWCLDSLAGRIPPQWWDWWTGREKQTGAIGHEMGHTIGLAHPDAANPVSGNQDYPYTIMGAFWDWPDYPANPADPTWPLRGLHGWADNVTTTVIPGYQDVFLTDHRSAWFAHPLADLDADGSVGLSDLAQFLTVFGLCNGNPGYDPGADFDRSGCIDVQDLAVLLAAFGS